MLEHAAYRFRSSAATAGESLVFGYVTRRAGVASLRDLARVVVRHAVGGGQPVRRTTVNGDRDRSPSGPQRLRLADRKIAAYRQVGQQDYLATRILMQNGFSASNIGGGYKRTGCSVQVRLDLMDTA